MCLLKIISEVKPFSEINFNLTISLSDACKLRLYISTICQGSGLVIQICFKLINRKEILPTANIIESATIDFS